MKSWSSKTQALLLRIESGTWKRFLTRTFMYLRMGLGGDPGGRLGLEWVLAWWGDLPEWCDGGGRCLGS